jgi:hypothetical protein
MVHGEVEMEVLLAAVGNLIFLACQTLEGVTWNAGTVSTLDLLLVPSVLLKTACPEDPLPTHNPAAVSETETPP